MPYKKYRSYRPFKKVLSKETEKNPILVYPGLRYAHQTIKFACKKKVFFSEYVFYKNRIAVEKKKQKKLQQIQNYLKKCFLPPSKYAGHTFSIYRNCMITFF